MQTPQKLIFIDDEVFFARPYVDELEKIWVVSIQTSALRAVDELQNRGGEYLCAVLDVMLPPPSGWEVRTNDGLDTGLEVLRRCRECIIAARLPVIVLTHRALPYVKGEVDLIQYPPGQVEIRTKLETPPFFLMNTVKRLIGQFRP